MAPLMADARNADGSGGLAPCYFWGFAPAVTVIEDARLATKRFFMRSTEPPDNGPLEKNESFSPALTALETNRPVLFSSPCPWLPLTDGMETRSEACAYASVVPAWFRSSSLACNPFVNHRTQSVCPFE